MKVRAYLAAGVLLLVLFLGGCAKSGAAFSEDDLRLTLAGSEITAETPVDEILSALGDGYEYAEAISCVYTGMDKTYIYDAATLYTYPDGETDWLMELYCEADVQTSRGIGIGASKDDILAQYGDGFVETGSLLSYELPVSEGENLPASLYFVMLDGKVAAIAITAEHRAE